MTDQVPPYLRAGRTGIELDVLVSPRASRSRVLGAHEDRLKVQLAAPPVDGEANRALVALLAEVFGRPRRDVTLVRGETSRRKTVGVEGVALEEAFRLLGVAS